MLARPVTLFALAGAATAFVPTRTPSHIGDNVVPAGLNGDLEIVSFGIAKLSADRGAPMSVLHVRETFANRGDKLPWVVDLAASSLWLGGTTPPTGPALVNSDVLTLPLLLVSRGERRIADLYFPIPADRSDEDALAYLSLTVRVHTADQWFDTRALLVPSRRWPTPDQRGFEPGWGRTWWAEPSYPWSEYWHRPGRAVPRPPKHIEIIHVPRAYYEAMQDGPRTDECDEW